MLTLAVVFHIEMSLIPGAWFASPGFGLLIATFAAVVKRPFVQKAGVIEYPFCRTLQATAISLIPGHIVMIVTLVITDSMALYGSGLEMLTVVPTLIVVEWLYLRQFIQTSRGLFGYLFLGHVVTFFACVGLVVLLVVLREHAPSLRRELRPHTGTLTGIGIILTLAIFLTAFIVPTLGSSPAADAPSEPKSATPTPPPPNRAGG